MRATYTGTPKVRRLQILRLSAIGLTTFLAFPANRAFGQGSGQSSGQAHESARAAQMRELNNEVLQLHGQLQENGSAAESVRRQAAIALAQRASALNLMVREDPRAALSFAFSSELLTDLAAKFPDSITSLEQQSVVRGELQHWVEDGPGFKTSRSYFQMKLPQKILNLHFTGTEPPLKTGEQAEAAGIILKNDMAVANIARVAAATSLAVPLPVSVGGTPFRGHFTEHLLAGFLLIVLLAQFSELFKAFRLRVPRIAASKRVAVSVLVLAIVLLGTARAYAQASVCSTLGVQKTAVLLVTFPGVTPPSAVTPQSVQNMFFGTSAPSVSDFWRENSYGQTTATGDVFGWYTLTGTYTCATLATMEQDAINTAAAGGANFQNYSRVFVIFPGIALQCGWSGLATVGCSTLTAPNGNFTASTAYVDAGAMNLVETASHEGGHNLGLNHASTRAFGTETLGPLGAVGTLTEYGDKFSTMACCGIEEYASPHKATELGWLSEGANYQVVQSSGTYTLQPLETGPAGLQALKVQRGTGNAAWLWIEYRQPVGNYDPYNFSSPPLGVLPPQPYSGALIHYEDATTGLYTHLINFTPGDSSFLSPALPGGQSWADPYSNLSISVLSATPNGLTVSINYGSIPCISNPPSVVVSPLDPTIIPGQSANYAVSVTNNDSLGCSPTNLTFESSMPSSWSTNFSSSSLSLGPGQSATVSLGKGSPAGTPPGTYAVDMIVLNNSSTGTGTANATVMASPSVNATITVPLQTYSRKSTVPILLTAMSAGAASSGTSVTFTLVRSDGSVVTQAAKTGSNGTATWNWKASQQAPTGLYSVSALVRFSSQSVMSNTKSFTLQ